ncbi:MAG: phosphoenolpyruvate--protein phosphotransferase [Eubacteriales bacterium]|nr:phosphoenolpyruvate--protein phosphotransferase [Eubacteriales bacterium]
MITLTGKKISEGIAIGRLAFYKRGKREIRRIYVEDAKKEILRFQKACEKASLELQELYETMSKEIGEANAAMFEMQQMVLEDSEFLNGVMRIIMEQKLNAEYAVKEATNRFIEKYAPRDASYVRGHEADVKDVAARILRILARIRKEKMLMDEPFIMAARDLYPSEAAQLEQSKVLGIVTMYGSINSHTATIARTKEIPSVIGIGEALKKQYEGKMVIVDGFEGKLYIEPDQTTLAKMQEKKRSALRKIETLERLKGKENVTQSGQKIDVCANIGTKEDIESVLRNDANGIGLFRSEFIYMESGLRFPTEEQQFQIYKLAAEAMGTKRVVIRTTDIGGDKSADCLEITGENNPAMGYRGIRVSLDKEEMFKVQLRAILRASAFGNFAIMFPMISSMEEVIAAKNVLAKVKQELRDEKILFDEAVPIGVMIETPAAVMISGELAREMDFLSIGTNDLTQFTLAMDRTNRRISGYYNPKHPALIKMIRIVANNVHLEGKRISICGDLAADLSMTEQFINMGIDELSVAPSQILPLRKHIRELK